MGLRFRRSITLCKGVRVNFGMTGASISVGTRGARYTVHSSGRRTASVGIPGTGLYYTQSSNRKYRSNAYVQRQRIQEEQKRVQRQNEQVFNQLIVRQYDNYIDTIKSVHKECKKNMDWEKIYQEPMPGDSHNESKKSVFEKIRNRIEKILFVDASGEQNEKKSASDEWKEKHDFASRIISGETDAYLEAISDADLFDDILGFGSEFEIGTDSAEEIEVEFKVMSEKVVPEIELTLTQTGKLSKRELTKTAYYDYTQDYVCSCSIRIGRELFALLPVTSVVVHAVEESMDTANENVTIMSVRYLRNEFMRTDFDNIDPSDFVETFQHNMNFFKTKGFKAVNRLEE